MTVVLSACFGVGNSSWPSWVGALHRPNAGGPDPGGPWEVAIAFANAVGRDMWINIPVSANDEYISALAQLLKTQLHPELNVNVEFSNELWNWMFPQSHTAVNMANASVHNDNDPFHLNYDNISGSLTAQGSKCTNNNPPYCWQPRICIYNTAIRIPKLFAAVFGAGAVGPGKRVRPVFATQVWDDNALQALQYLEDVWGSPKELLHALAIAPYFSAPIASGKQNVSVDQVINDTKYNILSQNATNGWSDANSLGIFNTLAAWHGVQLLSYEGGPSYSGNLWSPNKTQEIVEQEVIHTTAGAQRDPRFAGLFQLYLSQWYEYGAAGFLTHFYGGATDFDSQWGCWGLIENVRQPWSQKTIGFDAARKLPIPANKLGLRLPVQKAAAKNFMGNYHSQPQPHDALNVSKYSGPWNYNHSWLYPLAANASDLQDGNTLNVVLYTALPGPAAGQKVELCVQGLGGLRCDTVAVPSGGSLDSGGVPTAAARLPLKTLDGGYRGLLTLYMRAVGTIPTADDATNYWIVAFDASIVNKQERPYTVTTRPTDA